MVISERAVFDERYFPGSSAEQMKKCPWIDPSALYSLPLVWLASKVWQTEAVICQCLPLFFL
jgi:hypothetical protein